MRKWGEKSKGVRATLDPRLQKVVDRVLHEVADVSLLEGYRSKARQNALYLDKKSKLTWPHSKHNTYPALAVDLQPYPMPKREEVLWASLGYIAGRAIEIAKQEGVELRWGGDWNRNGSVQDERFHDLFHLEVYDKED